MIRRLPLFLFALSLSAAALASGDTLQTLFVIERNINKNVVHYDARLRPDGTLDPTQPVVAYWIMAAEDGRRQELNLVERVKAYGFTMKKTGATGPFKILLAADRNREILVDSFGGVVRAQTSIAGHPAYLHRIYITTRKSMLVSLPESAELIGEDTATGQERREVIGAR